MKIVSAAIVTASCLLFAAQAKAADCNVTVVPGQSLQKAIDELPSDGSEQTVCLTRGEFTVDGLVSIQRNNVTLRGSGKETVVQMKHGVQQPVIVIGGYKQAEPEKTTAEVTVENMTISGNSDGREFMPELPYLSNSGVIVRRGESIVLRNLNVSNCRSACLLTEQKTKDVVIENNHVTRAQWDGISFNSSSHIILRNNEIADNVAAAVTAENVEDSLIENNTLNGNGSHGVYLSDSYRNTFRHNDISDNKMSGIFLTCAIHTRDPLLCWPNSLSSDNLITENTFNGNANSYSFGVDRAANCKAQYWPKNRWINNKSDSQGEDPDPERFGVCITRK